MSGPIRIVLQRTKRDCAVACLAMVTGRSYETVLQAFRHPVHEQGAQIKQLRSAAERLGFHTGWTRKVDLSEAHGILVLGSVKFAGTDHLVVLIAGLIVDSEDPPTIWEADEYLAAFEARPLSLITVWQGKAS